MPNSSHNNLEIGEQALCYHIDSILLPSSTLSQHFKNICTSNYHSKNEIWTSASQSHVHQGRLKTFRDIFVVKNEAKLWF